MRNLTVAPTKYHRFLTVMLLISILTGCGFQLRGSLDMSEAISPLYLEENSAIGLARVLKQLLATNSISVTNKPTRSNSQLTLLVEERGRRVLTVDSDGRAREYLLTYRVNFIVNIKQSGKQPEQDSIALSRSLLFDTGAVLAVDNESQVLYKDMRNNAARLILLKLQAHARSDSAQNDSSTNIDASAIAQ